MEGIIKQEGTKSKTKMHDQDNKYILSLCYTQIGFLSPVKTPLPLDKHALMVKMMRRTRATANMSAVLTRECDEITARRSMANNSEDGKGWAPTSKQSRCVLASVSVRVEWPAGNEKNACQAKLCRPFFFSSSWLASHELCLTDVLRQP